MYCTLCGYISARVPWFPSSSTQWEKKLDHICLLSTGSYFYSLFSISNWILFRRKSVVSHLTSAVRIAIKPCVPKMLPGWAGECGDSLRPGMASSGWNLITAGKLMLLSHSDVFRDTECAHQSLHSFTVKDYQNGICLWLSLMQMLM